MDYYEKFERNFEATFWLDTWIIPNLQNNPLLNFAFLECLDEDLATLVKSHKPDWSKLHTNALAILADQLFKTIVVQSLSRVWLFATPQTAACQASLSFTTSQSLLKLCPLNQWYHPSSSIHPLLLLPSIFPSTGSFPMSWLFESRGQSIGASASATFNTFT